LDTDNRRYTGVKSYPAKSSPKTGKGKPPSMFSRAIPEVGKIHRSFLFKAPKSWPDLKIVLLCKNFPRIAFGF
jgi:hypothetical protein